jgi:hypothetical protein
VGKGVKLSPAAATKLRKANRKLISANKDLNAAVQALLKASKAKSAAAKTAAARKAYSTVVKRNPLLRAAVKENLKKLAG